MLTNLHEATEDGVNDLESVTRRERRSAFTGSAFGSLGPPYHPSTFRSRGTVEWEERINADTGLLGITTKHVHFVSSRKRLQSGTTAQHPSSPERKD